jgi:hypothetical protein
VQRDKLRTHGKAKNQLSTGEGASVPTGSKKLSPLVNGLLATSFTLIVAQTASYSKAGKPAEKWVQ